MPIKEALKIFGPRTFWLSIRNGYSLQSCQVKLFILHVVHFNNLNLKRTTLTFTLAEFNIFKLIISGMLFEPFHLYANKYEPTNLHLLSQNSHARFA